jgi:hypothetical protein
MDGNEFSKTKQNNEQRFYRVMLMIYELEVVQSDSERIGDPVALPLTDIINNGGSANRLGKIS